jgi:hypothetical protein
MKLVSITPSEKPDKKWKALFDSGKITHFGSRGMDDFTITKDKEQRERYRTRHKKDLMTGDPTRAGFLSWYILWNLPSMRDSIVDYKKRFNM